MKASFVLLLALVALAHGTGGRAQAGQGWQTPRPLPLSPSLSLVQTPACAASRACRQGLRALGPGSGPPAFRTRGGACHHVLPAVCRASHLPTAAPDSHKPALTFPWPHQPPTAACARRAAATPRQRPLPLLAAAALLPRSHPPPLRQLQSHRRPPAPLAAARPRHPPRPRGRPAASQALQPPWPLRPTTTSRPSSRRALLHRGLRAPSSLACVAAPSPAEILRCRAGCILSCECVLPHQQSPASAPRLLVADPICPHSWVRITLSPTVCRSRVQASFMVKFTITGQH
jgi:hypothetical protein